MSRKYLKTYEELARTGGRGDPMVYLFNRFKQMRKEGRHKEAQALAMWLAPYGHAKALPRDDDGDLVTGAVFVLD